MNNLIDRYVLGARVAPVAVVAFSLFLAISAWIPFSQWPIKLLGGSAFLALGAFVLAQIARDAGKAIEGPLWRSWGGPPTVRMLRHSDTTIAPGSKSLIYRQLIRFSIVDRLPSESEERQDPGHADELYGVCSEWLRRKALELKAKSPFDVVHAENISYGFQRNILGIKRYGLAISFIALGVAISAFFFNRRPFIELAGILIVGSYLTFGVTEAAVKRSADEYAKRLLDAVQAIPVPQQRAAPRKRVSAARPGAGVS